MIETVNLNVFYGPKQVLENVNLKLENGKVTVILGKNGSGKTTLLKAAANLIRPDSGQVYADGKCVDEYRRKDLAKILSYLPQQRDLPAMSGKQLVYHGRFPYLGYPRVYAEKDRKAVEQALEKTGSEDFADSMLNELSGGQVQKLYLAMVLAQDTPNVLLDEPTSFLDIDSVFAVLDQVKEMAKSSKAVGIVLHDIAMALEYADCLILMDHGKVIDQGPPEELIERKSLQKAFGIEIGKADSAYYIKKTVS